MPPVGFQWNTIYIRVLYLFAGGADISDLEGARELKFPVRTVFNFPKIPYMHNKSKTSLDDKLDIAIAQLLYMKDVFQ